MIPDAHRIFCIGLNYEAHRLETKREPTDNPTVFLRLASSQIGHEQPLVRPHESTKFNCEGEIAPNEELTLTTRLNGQVMQQATTDMLIHSIPRQIAYISTWTALESGDVIVIGTPGGVGARREPPVWMKPGDVVEVEVSKVGVLRNPVVGEE